MSTLSSTRTVVLKGALGVARAREIDAALGELDAGPGPVLLDVRAAEWIDAQCGMILSEFREAQREQGSDVVWVDPSPKFLASAQRLGMLGMLGLPVPESQETLNR